MSAATRSLRSSRIAFAARRSCSVRTPIVRYQSTAPNAAKPSANNSGLVGGVIGGALVLGFGYAYYHISGAKKAVNNITDAKQYVDSASKQLTEGNLDTEQAVQWLRTTAYQYAAIIPGAKGILDQTFQTLDEVQKKHGKELSAIVSNAQSDLKVVTDKGLTLDSARKAWDVIVKCLQEIDKLATDITEDVMAKHPELQKKYGGMLRQMKKMSEQEGGEVKKYADETWTRIQDTLKSGEFDSDKIGKLIQDAMSKIQDYSEEAWKKAMEAAKPYLDKNPEIKKLLEENADRLKKEDFGGLINKVKGFAESGDSKPLKEWAEDRLATVQGLGDEAWKAAMLRASLYLDKFPDLKKMVDEKSDVLKKVDINEFMAKLREAGKTGDIKPVKEYIEEKVREAQKKS